MSKEKTCCRRRKVEGKGSVGGERVCMRLGSQGAGRRNIVRNLSRSEEAVKVKKGRERKVNERERERGGKERHGSKRPPASRLPGRLPEVVNKENGRMSAGSCNGPSVGSRGCR